MSPEELSTYCLAKPGAWPDEPWDGDTVAKVGGGPAGAGGASGDPASGKIFAFLGDASVGVKCGATRDEADEWVTRFPDDASVMSYIGRSGWNTLRVGGAIPDDEIREAVDTSYRLVVSRLARKHRPEGWDA